MHRRIEPGLPPLFLSEISPVSQPASKRLSLAGATAIPPPGLASSHSFDDAFQPNAVSQGVNSIESQQTFHHEILFIVVWDPVENRVEKSVES